MAGAAEVKFSTKNLALSGVLLAVSTALLYLTAVFPPLDLTLMSLAGTLVYLVAVQMKAGAGWIFFIAAALLAFLIVPAKLLLLPYYFCFGPYGILKYTIERLLSPLRLRTLVPLRGRGQGRRILFLCLEYGLKILVGGVLAVAGYLLFREAFFATADFGSYALPLYVVGVLFFFLIYDRLMTLIVRLYDRRIKPKL
jgi:hypothetical protein